MLNTDLLTDLMFTASSVTQPMPEIRVMTLSHFAFEHHYPAESVSVQPQLFMDEERLSIALDVDVLDEFTHETVLLSLLNLSEDVNLTKLDKPYSFGQPVIMRWHDEQQTYVRDAHHVTEQEAI